MYVTSPDDRGQKETQPRRGEEKDSPPARPWTCGASTAGVRRISQTRASLNACGACTAGLGALIFNPRATSPVDIYLQCGDGRCAPNCRAFLSMVQNVIKHIVIVARI